MIQIKSDAQIAKMREAGLVVGRTLALLAQAVTPGISTGELDRIAEEAIRGEGAVPSFLGYHDYPATICASVNDQVVHGIPSRMEILNDGDIVSLDCGAILDGWHGDSAVTLAVGTITPELQQLMDVTEESMWRGIAAARIGGRVSDIGHAIEEYAKPFGYGLVEDFTGHGIGTEMHQEPAVPNFGRPGRGPAIVKGLALAVEPMFNLGKRQTRLLHDRWTVVTRDGLPSAHFEHSFTMTDDGPLVLTALDGGVSKLSALTAVG